MQTPTAQKVRTGLLERSQPCPVIMDAELVLALPKTSLSPAILITANGEPSLHPPYLIAARDAAEILRQVIAEHMREDDEQTPPKDNE